MTKCQDEKCSGHIDYWTPLLIEVNFFSPRKAVVCTVCGMLYWLNGRPLSCPNRPGPVFKSSLTGHPLRLPTPPAQTAIR